MKVEMRTSGSCVRVSQDGTRGPRSGVLAAETTSVHLPGMARRSAAGSATGSLPESQIRLRPKIYSICLLLAAALAVGNAGCTLVQGLNEYLAYNDRCDEFVLGWRNHVWANQAWLARRHLYFGHPQFYALGEGFRAGYQDVASGGNGCPPALPPREFWSWQYQSGEGQAKVAAWFEGYPIGAEAAKEDGAGESQQIQVPGTVSGLYSPDFQSGRCPNCNVIHLGTPAEQVEGQPAGNAPAPAAESEPRLAPPQDSGLGLHGSPALRSGRVASRAASTRPGRVSWWPAASQDLHAVRDVAYFNDGPPDAWPQTIR